MPAAGTHVRSLRFAAGASDAKVSALLSRPVDAAVLLVLAHGAGAGMEHPLLEAVAKALAERRVATLRYRFPYMEAGRRRPDPAAVLEETVRAAVIRGRSAAPDLPLLAGGKSMGGRMTSQAAASAPLAGVRGLVFLGFPLHPAGRPSTERAAHLGRIDVPMLFIQGTRDRLADLSLLEPVVAELGARATLERIGDGDHSFHVRKRSGRSDEGALIEVADAVSKWALHTIR